MHQHWYHGVLHYTYQSQTCLKGLKELRGKGNIMVSQEQDVLRAYSRHSHAIPATAHGLSVAKTCWSRIATTPSCTTHRNAEISIEWPIPRPKTLDTMTSNRMNKSPKPTFVHPRIGVCSCSGANILPWVMLGKAQRCDGPGYMFWSSQTTLIRALNS